MRRRSSSRVLANVRRPEGSVRARSDRTERVDSRRSSFRSPWVRPERARRERRGRRRHARSTRPSRSGTTRRRTRSRRGARAAHARAFLVDRLVQQRHEPLPGCHRGLKQVVLLGQISHRGIERDTGGTRPGCRRSARPRGSDPAVPEDERPRRRPRSRPEDRTARSRRWSGAAPGDVPR